MQSGGTFDIDYTLTDPEDVVLLEGQGERQGDYILTANKVSMRWRMFLNPCGDGDVVDVMLQHSIKQYANTSRSIAFVLCPCQILKGRRVLVLLRE